ncbi:Polyisoprenoid-binding protein YceI [Novosphingobium sp. CF614]|uniref:YceI family protein n=1 Tax=Novosphingobium sp. CF614 TaxID=1884364 RepID=UPI0008F05B9D|nr:YceI family protein [Novosphingobium sp. CF614]SFG41946.1 Polyisoprenoid-binding protein YceI [Novosphingobium sp. CF614]
MNRLLGAACVFPPALAFAAAFALSTPLPAQVSEGEPAPAPPVATPGQPDPSLVSGGHYIADPHHTLVEWSVDHLGFSPYFGLFGDITGTLDVDPSRPEQARVAMTIPVAQVTVASPGLKEHLLKPPATEGGKPDFFGPSPKDAHFVSTMVRTTGDGRAEMAGNLTLNGVTRPVTLQVRFHGAGTMPQAMGGGELVGFEATGTLKRSDFGLDFSIPLVSDAVDLKIAAAFVKDAGGNASGGN